VSSLPKLLPIAPVVSNMKNKVTYQA
jgi:hypothetical protein